MPQNQNRKPRQQRQMPIIPTAKLLLVASLLSGSSLAGSPSASALTVRLNPSDAIENGSARSISKDAMSLSVNGVLLQLEQAPVSINGVTLVPMRDIFKALDADVSWKGSTQTVTAKLRDTTVVLQIGSSQASLNGVSSKLDVPPQILNGKTMIPARYVSESLGMYVAWAADANTVYVSEDPVLNGKTKQEIKAKSIEYAPRFKGDPFIETQNLEAPYKPGKLHSDFIEDGVKSANFARFLAGLPNDLVQDDALNELAQFGAVLTAAHGKLNHTPDRPSDMEESFYLKGYESTSSSNLYMRYGHRGSTSFLANSVWSYMSDNSSPINLASVGHRRWILNPPLRKVGFGYAESASTGYTPMAVFDKSRTEAVEYDFIGWPAKGYFPIQHFGGSDPWSVSLNLERYDIPPIYDLNVKLTRRSDGKSWIFNEQSKMGQGPFDFNANYDAYGRTTIVFRPPGIDSYRDSDLYDVEITGLKTKSGEATSIKYSTTFFQM